MYYLARFWTNTKTCLRWGGEDIAISKKQTIIGKQKSACHSEQRAKLAVELLRVERMRTSRSARHFCRSGIWLKISVAYQRNVTSVQKPPKLRAISLRRFGALVLPRSSLGKTSTAKTASRFSSLRMTGWFIVLLLSIENGRPLSPVHFYVSFSGERKFFSINPLAR